EFLRQLFRERLKLLPRLDPASPVMGVMDEVADHRCRDAVEHQRNQNPSCALADDHAGALQAMGDDQVRYRTGPMVKEGLRSVPFPGSPRNRDAEVVRKQKGPLIAALSCASDGKLRPAPSAPPCPRSGPGSPVPPRFG